MKIIKRWPITIFSVVLLVLIYFGANFSFTVSETLKNDLQQHKITDTYKNTSKNSRLGGTLNQVLKQDLDKYFNDIYTITSIEISAKQKKYILDYIEHYPIYRLSKKLLQTRRAAFMKHRYTLVREWEVNYGMTWKRYPDDLTINGKIKRYAGQHYDAHHIIELSWNGPNEWWNLVPASYPVQHQKGIHRRGGVCARIFGELPNYN